MKTWIIALLLAMHAGAQESGRLTLALSPEFMAIHEKRLGPLAQHVQELKETTHATDFRVLCLGTKRIASYEDLRFRDGRFTQWIDTVMPQVTDCLNAKDQENAACESSVALDNRLFDGKPAGRETMVILDWPCQRQGEVPGPEAFADPKFALAIPEGAGQVQTRGDIYWYFSPAVLELSLSKILQDKSDAEKPPETERCRLALARMWATYFRAKGFRLMAFDAGVPGEGRRPQNLAGTLQGDRTANQAIAPYDLTPPKPELHLPGPAPRKPASIRVFIQWEGPNVVLPVYRGSGDGEAIFPAAATEIPTESQKRVFKRYRAYVTENGQEVETHSRSARYRREIEGFPVTHCRELEIPVDEDGRAKGKLQLYLYDGKVRSADGFRVEVREGDNKASSPVQDLIFKNVEGQRERGRLSHSDENCWKTVEMNN